MQVMSYKNAELQYSLKGTQCYYPQLFARTYDFSASVQYRTSSSSSVLLIGTKMENSRVRKTLHTRIHHQDKFIEFGLEKSLAVVSKHPLKVALLRKYLHL